MPSINVRLTEAEHDELRKAVFARGRSWSLQKEILERLFPRKTPPIVTPSKPLDAVATAKLGESTVGKIVTPDPRRKA